MKYKLLYILFAWLPLYLNGQNADTLTLDFCLQKASSRNIVAHQKELQSNTLQNKLANITTNWYPIASINAQAVYNSEVTNFSDVLGNNLPVTIPTLPQDQYKIWADINQTLYDGGRNHALKEIEKAGTEIELQQIEADQLNIRQQISLIYFNLLLTQKNAEIFQLTLNELKDKKATLQAGVKHGVLLEENILAMEAEEIGIQQKLEELILLKQQYTQILTILTEINISDAMVFMEPESVRAINASSTRPELLLFDRQKDLLLANKKMLSSGDYPRVFAFSQVAYGRPGYNLISSDFHTFYSVGLGLKWDVLNYGDNRRQKKLVDIQNNMVDIKRQYFNEQLNIQLLKEQSGIEKYDDFMKQDEQIIALRKEVTARSLSKLNNGVITATDYLADLNAEITARLRYENHRILKMQSLHNYQMLQGKL